MKIRRYNGSSWVQEYPEVGVSAIVATGTPSSSTFLRGDGAWAVPTAADGNNYLTGVSGSGDGTVTFTRQGLSNLTWDASHTHSEYLPLSGGTMTGTLTYTTLNGPSSQTRDKIRVWPSGSYAIGMKSGYTYGGLNNDYAMSFQMNDDNDRGFWWGDSAHTDAQGAMALTTQGLLTVASGARIGYGGSDTTAPVSGVINLKTNGSTPDNTTATYEKGLTIVGGNQRLNIDVSNVTNGGAYIQSRHESTSFPTSEYTLALNPQGGNVTINGNTAWHAGNDGAGSGLAADTLDGQHGSYYTGYTDTAISNLIGGAPGALDTLNELAAAINDDSSYASTITTALAGKVAKSGDTMTGNLTISNTLPKIQFTDTNNDSDFHIANNNGVFEIADTSNQLERMKIDSSGNVTLPASGGLTLVDKALTNSSGAVLWDGDEIYHEGHKPTYTELGTMAYSNLTGTPTIPTNNNQLTNGAGYTTNTGTVTSVATGGGLTGGTITGSGTISHADTSSQASVNNSGRTYIQDITLDDYGHITGITSATETVTDTNTVTSIRKDNTGTYRTGNINLVGGSNVTITETASGVFSFAATDTNTTYSAGSGLSLSGTTFSHSDTSSQASVNNSGNTFIQDITLDTYGHITGITSATATSSGGNTWTEIKTGSTTITGGTTATNVSLGSNSVDDTTVLAIELNAGSVLSYTSQIFIVKLEDSSNTNAGILFNAGANSSSIYTGSLRIYRTLSMGPTSTSITFAYSYNHINGSSAETADTVYVGKIWKLGVTGS